VDQYSAKKFNGSPNNGKDIIPLKSIDTVAIIPVTGGGVIGSPNTGAVVTP